MKNKEKIYDEKIAPLMKQIIQICKEEKIPMFADFQYSNEDFCTTTLAHNIDGEHIVIKTYNAMSQCKGEENGINVDKFLIWLMQFKNTSSMYMQLLGKKVDSNA